MDTLDVVRACVRLWYVFVPVVLAAALGGIVLAGGRSTTYNGSGGFALVYTHLDQVSSANDPRNQNPLAGGGNPELLQETLVADLSTPEVEKALSLPGVSSGDANGQQTTNANGVIVGQAYSVTVPQYSASVIVTATGKDPQAVLKTIQNVLAAAATRVDAIQSRAGAPQLSRYTTFVSAPAQVVAQPLQSKTKLLVAIVGVGVLAGAALSLVGDRVLAARRRRREDEYGGHEYAGLEGDEDRHSDDSDSDTGDVVVRAGSHHPVAYPDDAPVPSVTPDPVPRGPQRRSNPPERRAEPKAGGRRDSAEGRRETGDRRRTRAGRDVGTNVRPVPASEPTADEPVRR